MQGNSSAVPESEWAVRAPSPHEFSVATIAWGCVAASIIPAGNPRVTGIFALVCAAVHLTVVMLWHRASKPTRRAMQAQVERWLQAGIWAPQLFEPADLEPVRVKPPWPLQWPLPVYALFLFALPFAAMNSWLANPQPHFWWVALVALGLSTLFNSIANRSLPPVVGEFFDGLCDILGAESCPPRLRLMPKPRLMIGRTSALPCSVQVQSVSSEAVQITAAVSPARRMDIGGRVRIGLPESSESLQARDLPTPTSLDSVTEQLMTDVANAVETVSAGSGYGQLWADANRLLVRAHIAPTTPPSAIVPLMNALGRLSSSQQALADLESLSDWPAAPYMVVLPPSEERRFVPHRQLWIGAGLIGLSSIVALYASVTGAGGWLLLCFLSAWLGWSVFLWGQSLIVAVGGGFMAGLLTLAALSLAFGFL